MRHETKLITPELAKTILESAPENVRKLIPARVDQFARSMLAGKWMLHHQGIAFDEDGLFRDGYNRLKAVVKSGCSVPMLVTYDVPRDGLVEVDGQTPRSLGYATGMTAREASICRVLEDLPLSKIRVSARHELKERSVRFKSGIDFALAHCGGFRLAVAALAARAFYHYSGESKRLSSFFELLKDKNTKDEDLSDGDSAAGEYRRKLRVMKTQTGNTFDAKIYCFGQTAVRAFMAYEIMGTFRQTTKDLFPLPAL